MFFFLEVLQTCNNIFVVQNGIRQKIKSGNEVKRFEIPQLTEVS